MLIFYIIITFLIFCLTGISCLYLIHRKKTQATFQNQQNTIALLKMETIRNRMSHHFFFNILSGITGETDNDHPFKKELKTLMMLSRRSVDNTERTAIPLAEELEVVNGYISLQRWRLPDQFRYTYEIDEETNTSQLIPAMLIQIPVENAIKHGLMPLAGEKLLCIKVENYDAGLQITIQDNGIGYKTSANRASGQGTGLKILYQTINLLNSENVEKIEISINEATHIHDYGKGTIVEIKVPTKYSYRNSIE